MNAKSPVFLALFVISMLAAACGDSKSPTGPSSPPSQGPATPAPPPAPPPNPTGSGLSFTPDTTNPSARTYSLTQAESNSDDVLVAVRANGFGPEQAKTLVYFRATLHYDPTKLTSSSFRQGDFMKQRDTARFSVSGASGSGRVVIRVDRQSEIVNGASGSGDVIYIRFRRIAGQTGDVKVTMSDAKAYWGNYSDNLEGTYGGTIHIQ
jgi:hypothetical protein